MLEKEFVITGQEARPVLRGPIPGPQAKKTVDADHEFLATTTKTSPIAIRQAKGSTALTLDGDIFLDFAAGVGVLNVGHAHPQVVKAIQDQAARFTHFAGTDYYYDLQVDLAKQLAALVPGAAKQKVFYTNSGTESNEAALKIAAWSSQRRGFLAFQKAFHGRTLGSLALTNSKPVHRERFPTIPNVQHVPFPNCYRNPWGIDGYADPARLASAALGAVEDLFDSSMPPRDCAAMFVEPVQGEGGYNVPPKEYFPKLKKILDGHGILMVADEVQTGFGRTGKMFAMEHFGVRASITTLAKAMASGMPIGAAVFDAKLDFGVPGAHSNTFGGNPVACAAALATLDVLRSERLPDRAAQTGKILGQRLREVQAMDASIGDVRGLGLMWAAEFIKDPASKTPDKERRDRVVDACVQRGLIVLPCGKSAIRFIPPLVVTEAQVHGAMDVFAQAVKAVA